MRTNRRSNVYAGPNAYPGIRVEVVHDQEYPSVSLWMDGNYIVTLTPDQAAELASRLRRAYQRVNPLPAKRST